MQCGCAYTNNVGMVQLLPNDTESSEPPMPKASGKIPFGSNMPLTTGNVQCHGARQLALGHNTDRCNKTNKFGGGEKTLRELYGASRLFDHKIRSMRDRVLMLSSVVYSR